MSHTHSERRLVLAAVGILGLVVASAPPAHSRSLVVENITTFILELNTINADKIDGDEPGSENEFFGNLRASFYDKDGKAIIPISGGTKFSEGLKNALPANFFEATRYL